MVTRRRFSALAVTSLAATAAFGRRATASASFDRLGDAFAAIERGSGGRLGIGVIDTATGAFAGHRADELFPLCSTFKLLCAAAVLKRVDAGEEQLGRRLPVTQADLLDYAPITKPRAGGDMAIFELCDAMVTLSDNTAANLLLGTMGGPPSVTALARSIGDTVTRLDRTEPELNTAIAGDARDTTSPRAMARSVQTLTLGAALSPKSRAQLDTWLIGCKTGDARLRAGLPNGWLVGDKTGSGDNGTSNDAAVIWPPRRAPLVITAYLTQSSADAEQRKATFAAISKAVVDAVGD